VDLATAVTAFAVFHPSLLSHTNRADASQRMTGATEATAFAPIPPNPMQAPAPSPQGMVWISGGEFSMGAMDPPATDQVAMHAADDARVLGHDIGVHASFRDIFSYFNIGLMGEVEARKKRVLLVTDVMWMRLSGEKGIPLNDVGIQSVDAKVKQFLLTPGVGYRVVDNETFTSGAGLRRSLMHSAIMLRLVGQGHIETTATARK